MIAGTGIYTPRDAAALLGEQPATVRRWAWGYSRPRAGRPVRYPPLIATELPEVEGEKALTFVELVELLYVRAFQRLGVPWQLIRHAAALAAKILDTEHPFALRRLYVDPRGVYAELREADGSESLVHLVGEGQHAIAQIVRPYLNELEFDVNEVARRWWPMGKSAGVVVDPMIAFGAPVVEGVGMRASSLSDAYDAELPTFGAAGAVKRVAWTYDIDPADVKTALGFREWLRRKAA